MDYTHYPSSSIVSAILISLLPKCFQSFDIINMKWKQKIALIIQTHILWLKIENLNVRFIIAMEFGS